MKIYGFDVPVEIAGTRIEVTPHIRHTTETTFIDFADLGTVVDTGIRHRFQIALDKQFVTWDLDEDMREDLDLVEALRQYDLPALKEGLPGTTVLNDERLLIADLSLYEFPVRFKEAYNGSWFVIMDAIDGDTADLGVVADQLVEKAEERGDLLLLDGSLFVPKMLSVHPMFRGGGIGIRLLAHSLWLLSRSCSDLALALAKPMSGLFDLKDPDCSAASIRRLLRYYGQIGFRPVNPRAKVIDGKPVPIVAYIGRAGLDIDEWN